MEKIYLYAAHTSFSPGGMLGERTEHGDVLKFARFTACCLENSTDAEIELLRGNIKPCPKDATVIIFHRNYNEKNEASHGAGIYVPEDADCETQYEASRLLESICRFGGFRYKGVHMGKSHPGFSSLEKTGCKKTFLITLGFMDSVRDNKIFDEKMDIISRSLCEEITDIIKEREYENRINGFKASLGGD